MTRFLQDILREPAALRDSLQGLLSRSRQEMDQAVALLRSARQVQVVGIGSSWNAGIAVNSALHRAGLSSYPFDASEILNFGPFFDDTAVLVLSRSGRSVEIVRLIEKIRMTDSRIVAVTNTPDSPLAVAADVTLHLDAGFDHLVSVVMYSGLVLGGCVLAALAGKPNGVWCWQVTGALETAEQDLGRWREQIQNSGWLDGASPTYFLARGPSLASAQEARLLWEEAAKMPATALTTGGFRHGSQEMLWPGTRIGLWIDPLCQRDEDLQLAADLRAEGAKVFIIGQELPADAADLVIGVPPAPPGWQPLIDIIPAQLAAELLAELRGHGSASFRYCPYIIEHEGGLAAGGNGAKGGR